jgi:hypothetical protein
MGRKQKLVITPAAALVLGASGVGIAQAVRDSDTQASGPEAGWSAQTAGIAVTDNPDAEASASEAEQAGRAAVQALGGGRVVGIEREDEGRVAWEVEVVQRGGGRREIALTRNLKQVAVEDGDDNADNERETEDDDGAFDDVLGQDDD